jgi:very-short-patch-repair endonuclease
MANRFNMRGGRTMTVRAQRLCRQSTDAERALWRLLRQNQLGRRFHRQFPIPPYIVDFICLDLDARLIVEADGGQHALPGDHDKRDAFLSRKGWRVLRFWNNEILQNRAGVYQRIAQALEQSPHPNPPPLAGEGVSSTARRK